MKINIDVPVNIGDVVYSVRKYDETAYEDDEFSEVKVDSLVINKDVIFIVDDIGDWYGRADKMDCPISEAEFIASYTTKENARKAIEE